MTDAYEKLRLLLVEDNPDDVKLVGQMISASGRLGWTVERVGSVHEALDRLAGAPPDAILLDLLLPDSTGVETVTRVRAAAPTVPIVVLTSLDDDAAGAEALNRGAQDYLVKSRVDRGALTRAVRSAIERMREIKERKDAEDIFRSLLESSPDAIVIVDTNGKIRLINSQTERLFGYPREEILGRDAEMLMPERFREEHLGHRSAYGAKPHPRPMGSGLKLYGLRKNGEEFPVEIGLSPMQKAGHTLISIRDVSAQRQMAEELAEQYLRVAEATRLKSEFLANMSHELRTPLNSIIGFTELMYDGKAGDDPRLHHEYLGDILSSSRHLLQIINEVLDLAKIESGKMQMHPEAVAIAPLVLEVCSSLNNLAAERQIEIQMELAADIGELIADPAKLKQVLYNYLSNALKFTDPQGVITVRVQPEGHDRIRIEVEDSGIGIAAEDLGRLFVEFQQLDSRMAKKHQGTGLGLALTKRLVEAHGGRVGVKSTLGRGSTFFAVLPRSGLRRGTPANQPAGPAPLPPGPGAPNRLAP